MLNVSRRWLAKHVGLGWVRWTGQVGQMTQLQEKSTPPSAPGQASLPARHSWKASTGRTVLDVWMLTGLRRSLL